MSNYKIKLLPVGFSLLSMVAALPAIAQGNKGSADQPNPWTTDTLIKPVPLNRQLFTGKVDKEIERADKRDGQVNQYIFMMDSTVSDILTGAIIKDVTLLETHIENLDVDHAKKIKYHRAVENMMRRFNNMNWGDVEPVYFKRSVKNLEGMIQAAEAGTMNEFAKANGNIYSLDNSLLLDEYPEAKSFVFEQMGRDYPEMMIKRLPEMADKPYADPTIAAAAKIMPGTILNYALSTSSLSAAVRRNKDPLVQAIVKIATQSRAPLKALPFLGDIYANRKTVAEVDAFSSNEVEYYKNLVRLKIQNEQLGRRELDEELAYRALQFVRVINELHNESDAVRFKSIQGFSPEELYIMMLGSQDEIYTSSFTKGTFKLMMDKLAPMTGDELLEKMHKYHFRTFIRMCAGFNTLSTFFNSFGEGKKTVLMKEFVADLEQGTPDNLEDAVDVADAFGSITDADLIDFLKKEVKSNYERTYRAQNAQSRKGIVVYGLLSTIFNSSDNSEQLSDDLSVIPPITYVSNSVLKDGENGVVQQVFFYGDKDGAGAYANYMGLFRNAKWKVTENQYWATITSTGDNKMTIYANKALPEPEDEAAQNKLQEYLDDNNIHPSVFVHRGHSYFLPTTIEHLNENVKVVMLGSCGGYHNLSKVLDRSPDAHIISSKQVGALNVNVPIIKEINDRLVAGKDLDWIDMWSSLGKYFSARGAGERDLFSDYIPPNKNLGAIFIKAYRKITEKDIATE